jgi:hypothetical protein
MGTWWVAASSQASCAALLPPPTTRTSPDGMSAGRAAGTSTSAAAALTVEPGGGGGEDRPVKRAGRDHDAARPDGATCSVGQKASTLGRSTASMAVSSPTGRSWWRA